MVTAKFSVIFGTETGRAHNQWSLQNLVSSLALRQVMHTNNGHCKISVSAWALRQVMHTNSGNTLLADDEKRDCDRLTLSEEEHLSPYEPQGQGCVHSNE